MIVDSLLNLIIKNTKMSKLGSRCADLIFPGLIKTYRIFIGPACGLRFKLNARKQTAFLFGTYEYANVYFLLTHLSDKTVFWDIGAHIGYFTCIMARRLSKGCIVAIEPFPENIKLLHYHITLNDLKNIIVVEKALSYYDGKAIFFMNHDACMGRIVKNIEEDFKSQTINVPVSSIDSLVSLGLPVPHIIKIDAEGEEGNILKGAITVLQEYRPSCLIEIHTKEAAKLCWDILFSYQYNIQFLKGVSLCKAEKPQDIYGKHVWAKRIR